MKIELMAPAELVPYAKNPRKNQPAVDYVANSIKEFGFRNPILIDKDKVIIAGHTRLLAAEKLGIKQVPVIRIEDLTPDQVKALRLADNKTAEFAEWDRGLLDEELADLRGRLDMRDFGFLDPEPEGNEDDVPATPIHPKAQLGDLYQLGEHRLLCGDATKAEDVQRLMAGEEADLVVTDPPYNVAVNKTKSKKEARQRHRRTDGLTIQNDDFSDRQILNDDMDEASFAAFLEASFAAFLGVLRKGGAFYVWLASTHTLTFWQALTAAGLEVKQVLVWVKDQFVLGRQDYQWRHEPCFYGWKPGAAHYFVPERNHATTAEIPALEEKSKAELIQLLRDVYAQTPTDVLEFDRPKQSREHPTMKPVKLIETQIRNSSRKGDIVLDTFGGSGTTLIAAENLGRRCRMIELDPRFVDVIIERWEKLTGKKAEKITAEMCTE